MDQKILPIPTIFTQFFAAACIIFSQLFRSFRYVKVCLFRSFFLFLNQKIKKHRYHPFQLFILQSLDPITQTVSKIRSDVLIQQIGYNCYNSNRENRLEKISFFSLSDKFENDFQNLVKQQSNICTTTTTYSLHLKCLRSIFNRSACIMKIIDLWKLAF